MTAINRRQFLASLAALGEAIALPAKATDTQVAKAWEAVLNDPWFFEVNDSGTIVESDGEEPRIRRDVYNNIWCGNTPEDLIREVDQYSELRSHFQALGADELEDVEMGLDDDEVTGPKRKLLLALQAALQGEDDGWQTWVRLTGPLGLPRFQAEVDQWLAGPLEWSRSEFWPQGWSSQGKALQFFQQMDGDIVDDLGVVIVEGDHPGSTYFAAELRATIEEGNEAAQRLGLPFRFREEA